MCHMGHFSCHTAVPLLAGTAVLTDKLWSLSLAGKQTEVIDMLHTADFSTAGASPGQSDFSCEGGERLMGHALALPLLDFLAYRAGCTYLSDLPRATGWQRARLAQALNDIPADAASLHDWNDALDYLIQAPPAPTAQEARARLMAELDSADFS